ncbi:MAG: hypothetical protein Fur0042_14350 [Cyanophyceae cyanobacterium]
MVATPSPHVITWQKLPDDFPLPDDPVDNIAQPAIAAALTESLRLANRLPTDAFTCTNYGICATLNGKMVVKAPDWAYIPRITVTRDEINRSYTPQLQGDIPAIVLEFLSETEGTEYSIKSTYPPGKFFFYEQILHVPNYGIFDPKTGVLELYRQGNHAAPYRLQSPDSQGRVWIPELDLFLGPWQGQWENLQGHWLRWWDAAGNLLLWGPERVALEEQRAAQERERAGRERERAERERERAERERERAERERERAERLLAQLRAAGLEPED